MYREITEDADTKMAERWDKDAKGIILFVSSYHTFHTASRWLRVPTTLDVQYLTLSGIWN